MPRRPREALIRDLATRADELSVPAPNETPEQATERERARRAMLRARRSGIRALALRQAIQDSLKRK